MKAVVLSGKPEGTAASMNDPIKPVFYDESQRRGDILQRLSLFLSIAVVASAVALLINILRTPNVPRVPIPSSVVRAPKQVARTAAQVRHGRVNVDPADRLMLKAVLGRNESLRDAVKRLNDEMLAESRTRPVPADAIAPGHVAGPVRAAFFLNSDLQSLNSLTAHIDETTHIFPVWLTLTADPTKILSVQQLTAAPDDDDSAQSALSKTNDAIAIAAARKAGVAIIPVLQNYDNTPDNDKFRLDWLHTMLASPVDRAKVIAQALQFVVNGGYQGINIDFETDQAGDSANLTAFMTEAAMAFHAHNLIITEDIQTDSQAYNLPVLAQVNDFLIPMIYDEHSDGDDPGPIASQSWFEQELSSFMSQVPANKVVIGIGSYGYDYTADGSNPDETSFEGAVQTAQESRDGNDGVISIDPASLNAKFTYWDDDDNGKPIQHKVWLLDATSVYDQMKFAQKFHTLGAAMWRLGTEDPTVWNFLGKDAAASFSSFDPQQLTQVDFDGFGTQFEGAGDVLRVIRTPSPGARSITIDKHTGYIAAERFISYPSQYVIRRTGLVDQKTELNASKIVALTFDDGPDPRWTPQILDILEREHVPATFFIVGQQAEANPGLVAREWNEGMEIGNHSYTHPENFAISDLRTKLELDATQRVFEAITGHETTLFRAPNIADSEPDTPQELQPVIDAQKLGYLFIGERIDPTDWLPGITSKQIIHGVLSTVDQGNCILMHDAGGNTRQQTVNALPVIIDTLKKEGYRFVSVSDLIGRPRSEVFPAVPAGQMLAVEFDRAMFEVTYWTGKTLNALFIVAIVLGIGRVLFLGTLATIQARRERARVFDPTYKPSVSVVIAAYNEAKVVNRTIATLLDSNYPDLDIVVVDDGSKDDTGEVVRADYGSHPRVTILRKENGGKASALNVGIRQCRGEIVVALDADTVFTPDTVSNLVRHFNDPHVGAVSGNVKVGNRRNALTIWQAIEYITSQNFDRRAFDLLNCITVVPGAVGAWRKDAIALAGSYSSETLAEDTDLTFKIRRLGYKIVTDNDALAYTEAPDTLRDLAKQRFRWAFGTLQCLWKHRGAAFKREYGAFGSVAIPSLWIYQIGFQAIAPIVDVSIIFTSLYGTFVAPALAHQALMNLIGYWGLFSAVDMIGAAVAFRLDNEDMKLLGWLLLQRFVYRQLMYYVVLKSLVAAFRGRMVGWGKLDRKGTVTTPVSVVSVGAPATRDEEARRG